MRKPALTRTSSYNRSKHTPSGSEQIKTTALEGSPGHKFRNINQVGDIFFAITIYTTRSEDLVRTSKSVTLQNQQCSSLSY